ncbi:hypothetical protein PtB15_4B125 [Puccinia triticina]|nr:hypothetical protein PtB15_4B125 [Puccinia triticina]
MNFAFAIAALGVNDDETVREFCQIVFIHQHPELFLDLKITHEQKFNAINC